MCYVYEVSEQETNREIILPKLRQFNDANSRQFALSRLPGQGRIPLEVVALSRDGEAAGGIICSTKWQWLFIDILWVDDNLRGRGIGRRLMELAEAEAQARGCVYAKVGTYDFQAVGFYQKLGYTIVGVYEDLPPGHKEFWLRKDFITK